MRASLRGFGLTLIAIWTILTIAGLAYSQQKDIPPAVTRALLPAILLEAAFYLAAAMEPAREWLRKRLSPHALAVAMTAAALAPYCVYGILSGHFHVFSVLGIAGLAGAASFWFLVLGIHTASDWGFLILLAVPVVARWFNWLYPEPFPRIATGTILGFTMWIHTGVLSVLAIRRMRGVGFGLLPTRREWRIGIVHFFLFLPVAFLVEWKLKALGLHAPHPSWSRVALVAGTFVAFLWVAGLAEEFFFRGLLQAMITRAAGPVAGLVIASAIFGLAHLGFGHYPNWRFSILAGIAGLFYGAAYWRAGSIRAAMVTHALVVSTWRIFTG